MWLMLAFASAFFAGITSILAKCGIQKTDSSVATAIRTVVVLIFSWIMVFVTGSQAEIKQVDGKGLLFLVLSGLATGASWLCYFKALQTGDINKVTPIDKSSIVLTILMSFLIFNEKITLVKAASVILIGAGTWLMIGKKEQGSPNGRERKGWFAYAWLSAVFASLTAILGKAGIAGVESRPGYGSPYLGGACYGLDCCICSRKALYHPENTPAGALFYLSFRTGNRGILAMLL